MAAMKCPLCGAARLADKRFCPACGHDYEAVLDQSASGAEPIATKPTIRFGAAAGDAAAHPNYWQRRSRRGKTGIVAISAVFALGLIGNLGSPPDADDTSPAGASVAADVAEATAEPTERPTPEATLRPTPEPTRRPTPSPTERPTPEPTPVPTPLLTPVPTPVPTPVATPIPPPPTAAPASACHASYQGGCLGVGIGDYDCAGGSGDGPHYIAGPIYVVGYDEFGLDRDGDGVGCES